MSFKPLVATALVGALACEVIEARVTQNLNYTGWNGGTTIIGNMRGVNLYGGKYYNINPNATNLEIVAQPFYNTNKTGYGIIFERSSYSSVNFVDTTFLFHQMSTSASMTAIYLKDNTLSLTFGSTEDIDMLFKKKISGGASVAGFVTEKSNFALNAGKIVFQDVVESSNGPAYGFLSKGGVTSRSIIQISDGESARRPSAVVKFESTLQGREAYGIRFQNNAGENFLDIRQNTSWMQTNQEAGGIYFNSIKGTSGRASLFFAEGNTLVKIEGKSTLRANSVSSTQSTSLITANSGNVNLTLNNGASVYGREIFAQENAYGLQFMGLTSVSSYANIHLRGGSTFVIDNINASSSSNVYGIQSNKNLTLDIYGENSRFDIGTTSFDKQIISAGNAYGINVLANADINAINGGKISFGTISGRNAYGIYGSNNIVIRPQGNGSVTFNRIFAGGRNGERAVGIVAEKFLTIQPEIGGSLVFGEIVSKSEANGIRVYHKLVVDHTNDPYQSGKGSGTIFKSIQSYGHNAIGIYTPGSGNFSFKGGGRTTFENIEQTTSNYTASGIIVDQYNTTLNITQGHELSFNNITSYNDAYGIKVSSLELSMNGAGLLKFGNIEAKNGVTGISTSGAFKSWIYEGSRVVFNNLTTQNGSAYALRTQRGEHLWLDSSSFESNRVNSTNGKAALIYADTLSVVVANGSSLSAKNISARSEAEGIKTDGDLQFVADNQSMATFANINATGGSAYGIKTGGRASVWTKNNGNIIFENISGTRDSAGIVASNIAITTEQESYLKFKTIHSTDGRASGLEGNTITLTGINNGQIYFKSITSDREANGIRVSNNLSVNLAGASSSDRVVFEQIRSQNGNAMGIYTYGNNANVSFNGSGSNVAFKDISHFGDSVVNFAGGIVSEGVQLNLSIRNGNNVWLDKVASNNEAFGLRGNAMNIYIDNSSSLNIVKISGRQNAYGLLGYSRNITLSGGGVIKFGSITSSRADAYAIYTANSTLSIENSSMFFGSKTDSNRYGIYNNINGLRYVLGDTSIQITGDNATGFYAERDANVTLGSGKTLRFDTRSQNGSERASVGGKINLSLGRNSNLVFNSDAGVIKRLNVESGANINLVGTNERSYGTLQLRRLEVESWNGRGANVLLYANGTATIDTTNFDGRAYQPSTNQAWVGGSDRLVIEGTNTTSKQDNTLKVALDTVDNPTKYVILAEVKNTAKDKVIFNGLNASGNNVTTRTEVGFDEGNITITRHDVGNTAYYVGKIPDKQSFRLNQQRARQVGATQNASSSVTSANFNNLNKRMGELRENSHAHGLWARVFNGEVESNFDDASLTNYTTIQAGYDYNLSSDANSNSYLGFALSYLNSKTSSVASDTKGNGVEAGVYFAYVQDSGLYTDSILKLSYMSNTNSSSEYSLSDTTNTSFILSQEVGYEADIGAGFYLTPQFETTYAYLGGSSMTATMSNGSELKSTQDATNNWRNRLGLQASYKLKGENESFLASFYAMGSYTYDYISGGDTTYESSSSNSETFANPIKSDGRFVLNVGSNIDIKDATRLYLDFEKSFGGKINTNYQINVGVRYSFGEKISK